MVVNERAIDIDIDELALDAAMGDRDQLVADIETELRAMRGGTADDSAPLSLARQIARSVYAQLPRGAVS